MNYGKYKLTYLPQRIFILSIYEDVETQTFEHFRWRLLKY